MCILTVVPKSPCVVRALSAESDVHSMTTSRPNFAALRATLRVLDRCHDEFLPAEYPALSEFNRLRLNGGQRPGHCRDDCADLDDSRFARGRRWRSGSGAFVPVVSRSCPGRVPAVVRSPLTDFSTRRRDGTRGHSCRHISPITSRGFHEIPGRHKKRFFTRELLAANKRLVLVYVLKDDLKRLWRYRYPAAARRFWRQWHRRAMASRLEPLKTFARALAERIDGVISHCTYPLHTGLLEGINNKIKVLKRIAYGCRDEADFVLKIRAAFPGIP